MKKILPSVVMVLVAAGASAQQRPLTLADAERIAHTEIPGGTVTEIERDVEVGRDVFEVEVRDARGVEHDLVIDAETGRVLSNRIDDD